MMLVLAENRHQPFSGETLRLLARMSLGPAPCHDCLCGSRRKYDKYDFHTPATFGSIWKELAL